MNLTKLKILVQTEKAPVHKIASVWIVISVQFQQIKTKYLFLLSLNQEKSKLKTLIRLFWNIEK